MRESRVFGVARSSSSKVSPREMAGQQVFHYSIPNVQEHGTGALEDGNSIASDKIEITERCVLISKLNPRKSTVCLAEPHTSTLTVASSEFVPLATGDLTDDRYLEWALKSTDTTSFLSALVSSATYSHQRVQPSEILGMAVEWPDREGRVARLDYLDRETGEIDGMIAKLDELSKTLRFRLGEVATRAVFGLNDGHAHRSIDASSPLVGIPDRWDHTKFGYDFVESMERNGDDPMGPLLSISEYRGVELNTRTDGQQASADVSKYRVVRPGQLAANMMWLNHGGLGVSSITGYISPDYKAFWISDRFDPRYVHYLFRSSRYIDYFSAISTGVRPNAKRVTKTVLDATPVPLPPLDEQKRTADHLDEVSARIDQMLAKVADLKYLLLERRSALITDVVTGRKDVA